LKTIFKALVLTNFLLGVNSLNAQNFEWARSFGSTNNDRGRFIVTDEAGNIYSTGYFEGTVDFDPGEGISNLTSAGAADIYIQKMDAMGNLLWAKRMGSTNDDLGMSIALDPSGNVYTTGRFQGTVDFNPSSSTSNITSVGGMDIFIQKLNASGNFLWAKRCGSTSEDYGQFISVDANGNVYTTGGFSGTVDFDPGNGTASLSSAGIEDIFIQKLSPSGDFIWAKRFGGDESDFANSMCIDAAGNVYTTGYFRNTVDFDPGAGTVNLTSAGDLDIFVQKLDASGNFLWAKRMGSTGDDDGYYITVDVLGNVYATGNFQNTVDFDPGAGTANLTSAGEKDIFVLKMDTDGNLVWAKRCGSSSADVGYSIDLDNSGNVYTTGYFQGTVDFDPGAETSNLTSVGNADVFMLKLNASGNFVWAVSYGGTSAEYGQSMNVDSSGNIYTIGRFAGFGDFDPSAGTANLTSAGLDDIFIQKISQCAPTMGVDTQTACESYTWMDGITYTSSNYSATHTLINAAGCDSIITLKLTLNYASNGTDNITACDSYTWMDGNTYTSDNNTATYSLENAVGCDSIVTLNLTINTVSDIGTTTNGATITANNSNATYQWLDCNNNNEPIEGATSQTFTATESGNYAVELTENGCTNTSACVAVTVIGIDKLSNGLQAAVYPNPSKGNVEITLGNAMQDVELMLTDIQGKVIFTRNYPSLFKTNIELPDAMGVYVLKLKAQDSTSTIKLVKD